MHRDSAKQSESAQREAAPAPSQRPSRFRSWLGRGLLVLISCLISNAFPLVREVIGSTLSGGGPESELVRWTLVGVLELSIVLFAGVCLMVFALAWRFFRLLWKSGKQFERRVEQKGVQATPSFLRFLRGDEDQLVSLGDESDRRN